MRKAPRVRTCWRLSRRGWVKSTASRVAGWRSLAVRRRRWSLRCLAGRPLGVDEQAEALLEAERSGLGGLDLLLAGVGHRAELHGVQLVEGLVRSASVLLVGRGVVVGAADVGVGGRRGRLGRRLQGQTVLAGG